MIELFKLINAGDKLIKGLNQSFLNMAGPASTLDNFTGRMKEFNDALYNSKNLKLGLEPKEVSDLFQSMSKSGLSLQGLGTRVASYSDSVEAARRLSVQFGVSLNDMGTMMTTQMLDLRSSLSDVSSTFNVLAYDAGKAGIQSDKFYQSVDAASSSLSFYGNYLKKASGMLRDFSTSGVMGFKDAAKQTTDLMGLYKNLSKTQKFAIVSMLGPKKVEAIFTEATSDLRSEYEVITKKMENNITAQSTANEEDKKLLQDELEVLKKEAEIVKANMISTKYALEKGDIYDKAEALLKKVEKTPEWLLTVLKISDQDIFGGSLAAQNFLERTFGLSTDMFNILKSDLLVMKSVFEEFNEKFKSSVDKLSDVDITKVEGILAGYKPGDEGSLKDTKDKLSSILSSVFKDKQELDKFINILLRYSKSKDLVTGKLINNVSGLLKGELTPEQIKEAAESTAVTHTVEGVAPLPPKDLLGIVKKITPFEKYLKVSKEMMGYTVASSDTATSTLNVLSDMFLKLSEIAVGVVKIASHWMWGSGKTVSDLKKETPYIKAVAKNEAMAQSAVQKSLDEILKASPGAAISMESIPELYKKWSGTEEDKKELMETFKDVPPELFKNLMDAYASKVSSSDILSDIKDTFPVKLQSSIEDIITDVKGSEFTSPDKGKKFVDQKKLGKVSSIYGGYVPEVHRLQTVHAMGNDPTDWEKIKSKIKDFLDIKTPTPLMGGDTPSTITSPPLMSGGTPSTITNTVTVTFDTKGGDVNAASLPLYQNAFRNIIEQFMYKYENKNKKKDG
jgi:hypothetical protein